MKKSADLKIGNVYKFNHVRKGPFIGQLVGVEHTPEGDKIDDIFLTVKFDVSVGTEQYRLKDSASDVRVSNIRPSLLIAIEEVEGGEWLLEKKTPKPPRADKELLKAMQELTAAVKASSK